MRAFLFAGAAALAAMVSFVPDARACGGCFHEPPNPNETPSLVVDHRMALSISKTQTILWDQVRYAGNPAEFAWVLPVRPGTDVEVGRDEFLSALESATAPTIAPPIVQCYYPPPPQQSGGGGGFGCGASSASDFPTSFGGADAGTAFDASAPLNGVDVTQKVVGPYETAILHSTSGQAISDWLTTHGFVIPSSIDPIIAYYTNLGLDFVAVRLRPDVGIRAMQPIRIVSPGADGTLPLRMVSAGIGATVGLELFVVSEGRYEAMNFANALVDPKSVKWDGANARSNYSQTFDALARSNPNGTWITEYAGAAFNAVSARYRQACGQLGFIPQACASDGGVSDGGVSEGGADGGTKDAGGCVEYVSACKVFDDDQRATDGMYPSQIQVTRLRTNLPAAALANDLKVGAATSQAPVASLIQTTEFTDSTWNPCPGGSTTPYPAQDPGDGCAASGAGANGVTVGGLGALALAALLRRRRRFNARP